MGVLGTNPRESGVNPSKLFRFLIFLQKIFVWTHESPIGDLGGRGPSPGVLKRLPQILFRTPKLLGDLLKDFLAFRTAAVVTEKNHSKTWKNGQFSIFLQK